MGKSKEIPIEVRSQIIALYHGDSILIKTGDFIMRMR